MTTDSTDFTVRRLAAMAQDGRAEVLAVYNREIVTLTDAQHAELDEILTRAGF